MTVENLLSDLHRRGLRAEADGVDIVIRGPRDVLTPELVERIKARKPELLDALAAKTLVDRLLDEGASFDVISKHLIWFRPASAVTSEVRVEVARLKREIIALLLSGHPKSRRAWGEPTATDGGEQSDRMVER